MQHRGRQLDTQCLGHGAAAVNRAPTLWLQGEGRPVGVTPGAQSRKPPAHKLGLSLVLPPAAASVVAWWWRSSSVGQQLQGHPKVGSLRIGHGSAAAGAPTRWAGMGTDGSTAGPFVPCAGTGCGDRSSLGPTGSGPSWCTQYRAGQVPVFVTVSAPPGLL